MKKHVKSFLAKIFQKKKKCHKIFFYLKNQLSGHCPDSWEQKMIFNCPDTVRTVVFLTFEIRSEKNRIFLKKTKLNEKMRILSCEKSEESCFPFFKRRTYTSVHFLNFIFKFLKREIWTTVRTVAKTVVQKYSWCNVYTTTKCRLCHTSMF